MTVTENLSRAIKDVVGPKGWSTDADRIEAHVTERRGLWHGQCDIVVSPDSTDEVAQIMSICHDASIAVVPQGGNTGLVGGGVPDGGIVLSLARLNTIRQIDAANFTLTAEAGCILADIQASALGVDRLHAVVGGSMGGMQALSLAANWPERAERVLVVASTSRHSAQNIGFHELGRQAIMADPRWQGGDYYAGETPDSGLAVARMAAHITYLSEEALTAKFGRNLQDREAKTFGFEADFQVESYLRYQGSGFTQRFDANSYLYITRAMDYFDLAEEHGGRLADAFANSAARFCLVSFDSDWLYPTAESRHVVHALNAAGAPVSFVELSAPHGHDSFLLDVPALDRVVEGFLK